MPISTPDALWSSPVARRLRPVAVEIDGVGRRIGRDPVLDGVDLAIPAGCPRPGGGASIRRLPRSSCGSWPASPVPSAARSSSRGSFRETSIAEGWARRVGYVGSDPGIPPWMTPSESLELAARLAGIDGPQRERLIDESLLHFQLGAIRDRPLRHAGRIVAERTALAAALLPDPEVLLLDEPLRRPRPAGSASLPAHPRRAPDGAHRQPVPGAGGRPRGTRGPDPRRRIALHAPIDELDAQRLPLSLRGMTALADLAMVGRPSRGGRPAHRCVAAERRRLVILGVHVVRQLWIQLQAARPAGPAPAAAIAAVIVASQIGADAGRVTLAIGFAVAAVLSAALVGTGFAEEIRSGAAAWLVVRAVPRTALIGRGWSSRPWRSWRLRPGRHPRRPGHCPAAVGLARSAGHRDQRGGDRGPGHATLRRRAGHRGRRPGRVTAIATIVGAAVLAVVFLLLGQAAVHPASGYWLVAGAVPADRPITIGLQAIGLCLALAAWPGSSPPAVLRGATSDREPG